MVYNVERVEVCFARCHDHFIRSRDSRAFNCQFADAKKREALEERPTGDRCELIRKKANRLDDSI